MNYADFTPEMKSRAIAATRRWQSKNPDKVKVSHKTANAKWRQGNKEKVRQIARDYYRDNPDKRKKYSDLTPEQKARRVARATAWVKQNPERAKTNNNRTRWRRAGIDVAAAERLLAAHSGKCDCCGTTAPGGRWSWNVDHDHENGEVRGILCHNCNTAIGKLGDTLAGVMNAVNYLKRNTK